MRRRRYDWIVPSINLLRSTGRQNDMSDFPTLSDFLSLPALASAGGWGLSSFMAINGLTSKGRYSAAVYAPLCLVVFAVTLLVGAGQHKDSREASEALSEIQGSKGYFKVLSSVNNDADPRFSLIATSAEQLPIYDALFTIFRVLSKITEAESNQSGSVSQLQSARSYELGTLNSNVANLLSSAIVTYGGYYIVIKTRFSNFQEYMEIGILNGRPAERDEVTSHDGTILFISPKLKGFVCESCPDWKW